MLWALLGEEEGIGDLAGLAPGELAAAVQELRRGGRDRTALGGLVSAEKLQGFLWGMGAATLLLTVLPSAGKSLRPLAVSTLKGAMDLADQIRGLVAEAGEGLQDLVAEVQAERLREAADPGLDGESA